MTYYEDTICLQKAATCVGPLYSVEIEVHD